MKYNVLDNNTCNSHHVGFVHCFLLILKFFLKEKILGARLKNKTTVITGGNTGIGKAICKAFAKESSNIVIGWYEHEAEALNLVDEITASNISVKAIQVDVTDEKSVKNLFRIAIELFGDIDILKNNA